MQTFDGLFVGLSTFDIVFEAEHLPKRNTKVRSARSWNTVGGPSYNAALTFAKLGGSACIYTAASNHGVGSKIHSEASVAGLKIENCATDKSFLPLATIVLHPSNGDRSIISHSSNDVSFEVPNIIDDTEFIFWDGYYTELYEKIRGANKNSPVVYDGGSWKEYNRPYMPSIDEPVMSERFLDSDDGRDWCDKKIHKGDNLIITKGSRPVALFEEAETYEIPVPYVDVVDTLGAGDVFHGAFCFGRFCQGLERRSAVVFASCIAALSCTRRTPHWWTRTEALEFYQTWKSSNNL